MKRVNLGRGPVTVAPLTEVKDQLQSWAAEAQELERQAEELASQAVEMLADAGAMLAPRWAEWSSGGLPALLSEVDRAIRAIDEVDDWLAAVKGGVDRKRWESDRIRLTVSLHAILVDLAERAPATTVPEADRLRQEAAQLRAQSRELSAKAAVSATRASASAEEVRRRGDSMRTLGFDAPYTAAHLEAYGPQPVQSPIGLDPGEVAYLSVPAARSDLNPGTLVLTNRRLAFLGQTGTASLFLSTIARVDAHADGVAVFPQGQAAPTRFTVAAPQHVVLHLNWCLDREREWRSSAQGQR